MQAAIGSVSELKYVMLSPATVVERKVMSISRVVPAWVTSRSSSRIGGKMKPTEPLAGTVPVIPKVRSGGQAWPLTQV